MKLPEDKRYRFKEPKGELFEDSEEAFEYLNSLDPKRIITVGDVVSAEFLKGGLNPDMMIIDFAVMRSPAEKETRDIIEKYSVPTIEVKNPAGHVTEELRKEIETAETPVKMVIDGEEDLATVPAILHAPEGSVVAYGQPDEGMVLVEVSEEKKEEFKDLFRLFEKEKDL